MRVYRRRRLKVEGPRPDIFWQSIPKCCESVSFKMKMTYPKSNLPAEAVAGNEDLVTEILLRIPIKPLLGFNSVSKRWLSLISSPRFARLYTIRNPNSAVSGLFIRRTPTQFQFLSLNSDKAEAPFYSLNFAHDPAGIKILQSCNGLLLCASFRKLGIKPNYYIHNPTTNNFLRLPSFVGDVKKMALFGVNLAFEPSQSPYYKVLCVRSTEKSMYHYQIEIYESELCAWRLSGSPFIAPFDMVFDDGVFWNGSIHWISPRGASLCFDLNNECLKRMPNIPVMDSWGKKRFRHLGESRGHLHLIEIYGPRSTQFKVFEMERDYSNWFVKYEIHLDAVLCAYPEMVRSYLDFNDSNYYAFLPLFLVRDENHVDASLLLHVPGKILSYNVRDKSFKQLFDFATSGSETNKSSLQFGWLDAYPYIESLVPVC